MEAIQQTRPLKVLVTGGAGFIGSALVRQLIKGSPHTVLNLDKLTYAGTLTSVEPVSNSPRYQFVQGDICNSDLVADLFATFDPDVVCNLAAESHVDRSIDGPAAFIETNTVGTYTLLQAALKSSAPSATKDYTPKLRHTIPARRIQPPQLAQIILSEHGTIITVSRSSSPALWTTMKLISSPRS